MNKLVHPATAFAQNVTFVITEVKDMTPMQQRAIWDYMNAFGDGYWGAYTLEEAVERFADVKFQVGSFPNDGTMKVAFATSIDGTEFDPKDIHGPVKWFDENVLCGETAGAEEPPVILYDAELAGEMGIIDWGHEWFYRYWCHLPETQFIRCLPEWKFDDTGRGGQ